MLKQKEMLSSPVSEINKEIREKEEIVNISEDIKDKCRELKRIKEGIQSIAGEISTSYSSTTENSYIDPASKIKTKNSFIEK